MGRGLAARLRAAGVDVVIGTRATGNLAAGEMSNEDATAAAGTVFLTVPPEAQVATVKAIRDGLEPGNVLVDCTVPLRWERGRLPVYEPPAAGSAAQNLPPLLPDGVMLVSGFHSVNAAHLGDTAHELDEDVLLCGDDDISIRKVAELVGRIPGLRAVDAGPLAHAASLERIVPVLIAINRRHKVRAGVRITGLGNRPAGTGGAS